MNEKVPVQLSKLVDRSEPVNVLNEARRLFASVYDRETFSLIERTFILVTALFKGDFPGYRKCTTLYHDIAHTLDAFLATSRLIDGLAMSDGVIPVEHAKRTLLAALFHDTGYIQESSDHNGTGAKYTKEHVERSKQFVVKNADTFSLTNDEVREIVDIIAFTEMTYSIADSGLSDSIVIQEGEILGTADLLGQMSDRTYLEKLLFLYHEFREAGIPGFDTEFDILRKTKGFYQIAMNRLDTDFVKTYRFAQEHFRARNSIDRNLYIESIERQIAYLDEIIQDESTNFRKKLKRLDMEAIEAPAHEGVL